MNNEQVKNFIIQQRQNGIPDAEIVSFLNSKGVNLQAQQEKSGSLVGNIIKDVGETLLVKPAARATEAATRLFAPNSVAARGYEAMADEGESQKILGIDVEAQKGVGGGRQIAGEALKTASYLFPYGKVAKGAGSLVGSKIAGNVASGVAGGYTADVGYNLTDEEKTVGESFVPGAGTIIGGAVPLVGPTVRGAGRLTKKTGEKIVDVVIPASKREAQILQTYRANNPFLKRVGDVLSNIDSSPTTAGKTVARTKAGQTIPGLFGTKSQIGVQAKRATKTLWEDVISPKLKESGQAVDLDGFFSKVQDDIIKNNPDLTRQKVLLKALQGIKNDYSGVNSISLEKLQKLKEGWAKPVPETAYSGKPISSAINDVRKQLSDEARGTIYDVLGDDIKQAYLDYGNLLGIQDMGVASMTGQKLKAGAGNFVSEVFSQAVTPIGTIAGQAIYRLGKGIEFVGNLGATNLGQALGVNLKFPGDAAIDDISKTVKKAKSLPNKQGGFIKLGQDIKAPMATAKELIKSAKKNLKDSPNAGFAEIYKGEKDLTTKILKDLEGKTTVSKQYILDATNRGELKQVERDLIRDILERETPKTVRVWNKSKFSNEGAYVDLPVIRKEEKLTLYQGGKAGDKRQFWTPDKKYAEQFGDVKEKTGAFYKVDNGNRMTDVYVEADKASDTINVSDFAKKVKAELLPLKEDPLLGEALKYKNGKEFYELSGAKVNQQLREKGIRGQEQVTKYWEEITGKKSVNSYAMSHRPQEMGAGYNIDEIGNAPNFYENPEYFKHSKDGTYDESIRALLKIKGKPEAEVTVYRASPKAELNKGDWISLSKKYAQGESLSEGTKVHSFKVKAKDIQFAGDDINEFGYFPK